VAGPARTDFRGAELTRVNLKNSNLSASSFADAEMRRIDLTHVNLSGSDLGGANLTEANLSYSNLRGADLRYTMLVGALFNGVDLERAVLRNADLTFAVLNGSSLVGADFSSALLSQTVIARCPDFARVRGLDTLELLNPCSIDLATLRPGLDSLPDELLEGMGLEPGEIAALRASGQAVSG
jgi:uncharacterized protein YjbI with pentapeptide repeats